MVTAAEARALLANPFGFAAAHHRPVGLGRAGKRADLNPTEYYGVPGTTGVGTRGRMAQVTKILFGSGSVGLKFFHLVEPTDPLIHIITHDTSGITTNLPFDFLAPTPGGARNIIYPNEPLNPADANVGFYPRDGGIADLMDIMNEFQYVGRHAKRRVTYGLLGLDTAEGGGSAGLSASDLRWPSTICRWADLAATNPGPIRHCLSVLATRITAPPSTHVLGRTKVWPAYGMDNNATSGVNNSGDIPYGCRFAIRWQDRQIRDSTTANPIADGDGVMRALNLTPRGKVLFDCLLHYGFLVLDGTPEFDGTPTAPIGGSITFRCENAPAGAGFADGRWPTDVRDDCTAAVRALVPFCWPLRYGRSLTTEDELHTDGLYYAAGGGPLYGGIQNIAWNAPAPPVAKLSMSGFGTPTYASGYQNSKTIWVREDQLLGTDPLKNFWFLFKGTYPQLRTTGNGGRVSHTQGYDIRFEDLNGVKLKHDLKYYNPTTGEVVAWIYFASLPTDVDLKFTMQYGNPTRTTPEADATGCWTAVLALIDTRTGNDRSGHGRHFTPTAVGAGTLHGPCGALDGATSFLEVLSAPWADGLAAATVQAWATTTRTGSQQHLLFGTQAGNIGLRLQHQSPGTAGAANTVTGVMRSGGTSPVTGRIEGPANCQDASGGKQLYAVVGAPGGQLKLFLRGAFQSPSNVPPTTPGPFNLVRGGVMRIGATLTADFWLGNVDEVRLLAEAVSEDNLKTQYANGVNPGFFYAVSGETPAGAAGPAATCFPVGATATSNTSIVQTDIDVLTGVAGITATTIASLGTPDVAGYTVSKITVAGRDYARLSIPVLAEGTVRFTYEVGDPGRTAVGLCSVVVSKSAIAPLVAFDDSITVAPDVPITYDVTGNDTGMQGAYTIGNLTVPSMGQVSATSDHDITFLYDSSFVQPVLSIVLVGAASRAEGNVGSQTVNFQVSRTGNITAASSVHWAISGSLDSGDMVAGQATEGDLTWAAGDGATQTIGVGIAGDTTFEADETLTVTLSNPLGATLGTASASCTITNDDVMPALPVLSIALVGAVSRAEGDSGNQNVICNVSRTGVTTAASSVHWALTGTLDPATDLVVGQATSGDINWAIGDAATKTITIGVLGDTLAESDETGIVTLSAESGATVGTRSVTFTISDDDTTAPGDPTYYTNPFNSISFHHRGLGDNLTFGIPQACTDDNARANPPLTTGYTGGTTLPDSPTTAEFNTARGRAQYIKDIRLGDDNIGRKWLYEVKKTTDYPMTEIMLWHVADTRSDDETVNYRLPDRTKVPNFFPRAPSGPGDFNHIFYPRFKDAASGGDVPWVLLFYAFQMYDATVSTAPTTITYTQPNGQALRQYVVDERDYYARPYDEGDFGTSASRSRHPGSVLRGAEINGTSPKFIGHALHCTGTRGPPGASSPLRDKYPTFDWKTRTLLSDRVSFPAYGVDGGISADENTGDNPYGTIYTFVDRASYLACVATLDPGNVRGKRVLEAIYYYGMALLDGQHLWVDTDDTEAGLGTVLQVRCDGRVGLNEDGSDITPLVGSRSKILDDIDKALKAFIPYLMAVKNVPKHSVEHNIKSITGRANMRWLSTASTGHDDVRQPPPYGHGWGAGKLPNHLNTALDAPTPTAFVPESAPTAGVQTWGLYEASEHRYNDSPGIVRHKQGQDGKGTDPVSPPSSGLNWGMFDDISVTPAVDEAWLEFNITFAPTSPAGYDAFDIETYTNACTNPQGKVVSGYLQSGKIPGIGLDAGGQQPREDDDWSARAGFETPYPDLAKNATNDKKVSIHCYIYDQLRDAPSGGRKLPMKKPWPGGSQLYLIKGTKYRWTQRVKINTPNVADGELEHWIDGVRVFKSTTMKWRGPVNLPPVSNPNAARVAGWKPHNYYGGNHCDGPHYDSYVKFGTFYYRTTPPDFDTPLAD